MPLPMNVCSVHREKQNKIKFRRSRQNEKYVHGREREGRKKQPGDFKRNICL